MEEKNPDVMAKVVMRVTMKNVDEKIINVNETAVDLGDRCQELIAVHAIS